MALCYLLTLYCFIRGTERSPRFWHPLAVLACLLGMMSKEVMVTAPAMVLLYDRTFVAGTFRAAWRQRSHSIWRSGVTWLVLGWLMIGVASRGVGYGAAWHGRTMH